MALKKRGILVENAPTAIMAGEVAPCAEVVEAGHPSRARVGTRGGEAAVVDEGL